MNKSPLPRAQTASNLPRATGSERASVSPEARSQPSNVEPINMPHVNTFYAGALAALKPKA